MRYPDGMKQGILPAGEAFGRAVRWLARQESRTPATIEAACRRFDLSPIEEDFLMRHFLSEQPARPGPMSNKGRSRVSN